MATFVLRQGGHCYYADELAITTALADTAALALANVQGTRLDNVTILVVDDEPDVCETVSLILEQHGAMVRMATSAAEALDMIAADRPDVLLADLSMPEIDGFTLMQRVRAMAGPIPAAALTAYRGADHRGRAESAGYRLFLEKPIA